MRTEKLSYDLPPDLIAQEPLSVRSDSRLLVLRRHSGQIIDSRFGHIGEFLSAGDCLVLNDTKVVPARFFARRPALTLRNRPPAKSQGCSFKQTCNNRNAPPPKVSAGAKLEGLFLTEDMDGIWTVYLRGTRRLKPGDVVLLKDKYKADFCEAVLLEKMDEGRCRLELKTDADAQTVLDTIGFPPLPPYIKRDDDPTRAASDASRYQTVYARRAGAVAAPTAGLHFTESLIDQLKQAGIRFAFVTLHVGAGTFKPITVENVEDHKIHREWFSIDEQNAEIINTAKSQQGRIIPIGTTSTRVLEAVAHGSRVKAGSGTTELFITPGYQFKITDAMVTNFHLPKSSLLALVAAFAGLEKVLAAYRHAIAQRYRFYSYGDAMLVI